MLKVVRLFLVALTIMTSLGGMISTQTANAQSYCTPGWWGHPCNDAGYPYVSWITNVTVGGTSNPTLLVIIFTSSSPAFNSQCCPVHRHK
jgi:hypothetical protein